MTIVPATDLANAKELFMEYLKETYPDTAEIPPLQANVDLMWNDIFVPSAYRGLPPFAAMVGDKLAGCVWICFRNTRLRGVDPVADFGAYVRPEYRGTTVLASMLRASYAAMQKLGITKYVGQVSYANKKAMALFTRMGGRAYGVSVEFDLTNSMLWD